MTNNENFHNAADESAQLDEQVPTAREERYAGFWMRFWAYTMDLIVVFSINGLLLGTINLFSKGAVIDIGFWTLNGIISTIVFYIYFVIMTKKLGQTLGKMTFGLAVIRNDYEPLKWSDLLFREVIGRFIYKAFFILTFLYFIVAFTKEKQGIHDMIGNTRVVHVN